MVELASVFDALDVGIIILDRQTRVVVWNDWIARATGSRRPPSSARSLSICSLRSRRRACRWQLKESFEIGSSSILTHSLNKLLPLRDETGREMLHNVIVRPVSAGPSQQCLLQINDVTLAVTRERVLRERQNARYHAIVDTAPDSIITVNLDLSIQWLNATAAQVFGYQPSELIGRPIDILLQNKNDLTASFLETSPQYRSRLETPCRSSAAAGMAAKFPLKCRWPGGRPTTVFS